MILLEVSDGQKALHGRVQAGSRSPGELRAAGALRRAVEEQALERFLACGDPHYGFARIYCDACGHDYLLAYSCKTRYFCPSCHQKRVLLYGEWVEQNVLAPVPHRQYVFTVPRRLRPGFGRHRAWLGELCRIAARLLVEAYAEALPGARPGVILFVQTFGDLANFNPHVHVLATDGAFRADGTFVALPAIPQGLLVEGFRATFSLRRLKDMPVEGTSFCQRWMNDAHCASFLARTSRGGAERHIIYRAP